MKGKMFSPLTALLLSMIIFRFEPVAGLCGNAGDMHIRVELDVFSGRQNPEWNLTAQEGEEFSYMFRDLAKSESIGPIEDGLGYRGLIVKGLEGTVEGYDEIHIYRGSVLAYMDNQSSSFIDKDRTLERWLFSTGKGRIDDDLYRQISIQIE
jgi:hypothetical protein